MKNLKNAVLRLMPLLILAMPGWLCAQPTLEGLPKVDEWTDFENQAGELPASIWGTCDVTQDDRIGIRVLFLDGTFGEATYSGVATHWNEGKFDPILPDTSAGFLAGCGGIHYLFNDGSDLPLAWDGCEMAYSNNFDLDYGEDFGSNFRASTSGWVQATFQTYCGQAGALAIPAASPGALIGLSLLLAAAGILSLRRLTRKEN